MDELRGWRANNPNIPKQGTKKLRNEASKKPKSFMKKQVASLVEAELKRAAKSEAQESNEEQLIQFPPEMDENWVRYGLAKLGQISRTKLAEDAVLCVHNTASALNR